MRYYAGLLITGHPLLMQVRASDVFLTTLTTMLDGLDSESPHKLRAFLFIYPFAWTYMHTGDRFTKACEYMDNPLAILVSRGEYGDNLLSNVFQAIGVLCTMVCHGNQKTARMSCADCTGFIISMCIENMNQYLKNEGRKDPSTYGCILSDFANVTGFDNYVDSKKPPDAADVVSKFEQSLRDIGTGSVDVSRMLRILRDMCKIDFSDFEPDLSSCAEIVKKYTPSKTPPGFQGCVPTYLSIEQLQFTIGLVESLSKPNNCIEKLANKYHGLIPDEVITTFLKEVTSFEFSKETLAMILCTLAKTAVTSNSTLVDTGFPTTSTDLIPMFSLSKVHIETAKTRLERLLVDIFKLLINSKSTSPLVLVGILLVMQAFSLKFDRMKSFIKEVIVRIVQIKDIEQKKTLFNQILRIIDKEILSSTFKSELIECGIPLDLIELFCESMINKPGVTIPKLRRCNKYLARIVGMFPPEYFTVLDEKTKNGMCKGKTIRRITGKDIFDARKYYPELVDSGGWLAMTKCDTFDFIETSTTPFLCIAINGHYRIGKVEEDVTRTKFNWPSEVENLGIFS